MKNVDCGREKNCEVELKKKKALFSSMRGNAKGVDFKQRGVFQRGNCVAYRATN